MDIPAHRAAAVVPTPAHSFELREGDQLVNLTEKERASAEAATAASAAVPTLTVESDQPVNPAEDVQAAEAVDAAAAVPVRATKGRRPATDAPAQSAQTAE